MSADTNQSIFFNTSVSLPAAEQNQNHSSDSKLHVQFVQQTPAASLTNQDFGSRVVDADGFQDGRSIVGHRHRAAFPSAEQNLILKRKTRRDQQITRGSVSNKTSFISLECGFKLDACFFIPVSWWSTWPTIPFGPRVLFTRSPMAMAPMKDDCRENTQMKKNTLNNETIKFPQFSDDIKTWNRSMNPPVVPFQLSLHQLRVWRCWPGPLIRTPAERPINQSINQILRDKLTTTKLTYSGFWVQHVSITSCSYHTQLSPTWLLIPLVNWSADDYFD